MKTKYVQKYMMLTVAVLFLSSVKEGIALESEVKQLDLFACFLIGSSCSAPPLISTAVMFQCLQQLG